MSTRINITISNDLNARLDKFSKKIGISKSSLCAYAIGMHIDNLENAYGKIYGAEGLLDTLLTQFQSEINSKANKFREIDY